MSGPVALVGGDEFLPDLADVDRRLLDATGRRRPRVVILAAGAPRDGQRAFERLTEQGVAHFGSLGAEVEPVVIADRDSGADPAHVQAVAEADLIYLCATDGRYGTSVLRDSLVWQAVVASRDRGAVVVGCGGGATVLAARVLEVGFRRGLPIGWGHALATAEGIGVLPAYDSRPESLMALFALRAPRGVIVLGIDRQTAVIGRDGAWEVHGQGRVTVWNGRRRERHRAGETFRVHALDVLAPGFDVRD